MPNRQPVHPWNTPLDPTPCPVVSNRLFRAVDIKSVFADWLTELYLWTIAPVGRAFPACAETFETVGILIEDYERSEDAIF